MTPIVVYSEDSEEHRYKVCQDEETELYFLLVDDEPYIENSRRFTGPFDLVLNKLKELKAVETLKTFD
jgi:hypothetical protein